MRTMFRATTFALVFTAAAAHAQGTSGSFKIGYVNTQALMEAAPGRAEAQATLEKEGQGYQVQLQKMQDSLNKMLSDYQKVEPTLATAAKTKRQEALQAFQQEMEAKNVQFQSAFQQRQTEVMAPIQDVVRKVLEDIRVEDGFAMILDKTPGQTPIIVADKNLDITDRVVSRLRATAKPAVPAAKPGAPSAPAGVTRPPAKPPTQ